MNGVLAAIVAQAADAAMVESAAAPGWHLWLTLGTLVLMLIALVRNLVPPDVVFTGGLVVVAAFGVITPQEAFHGLSNEGLVTVAAMFLVAAGLRETGALHLLVSRLLGSKTSERTALLRLTAPAAGLSGFVNNTPIVAILMPEVLSWCRARGISPSRMLIPLSYATILGGICTLIGTSTNLVVNGLMIKVGLPEMSLFELSKVGLPVAIVGIGLIVVGSALVLPGRKELLAQFGEKQREYIIEMVVESGCPLIGKSVEAAGLRNLPGLFLFEIDRGKGRIVSPVKPSDVLQAADRLVFAGLVEGIIDLQRIPGLSPTEDRQYDITPDARRQRRMCEAVVSNSFPELGKTIRNSDFRTRYDAVIVAVHRNGERLRKKIGDIVLRPGDTLLIQAGPHFERTFRGSTDFYLVSEVQDSGQVRHDRAWMALGVLALLVILLVATGLSTAISALIAGGLMVMSKALPVGAARRAIDWQVLIVIAAALGFGVAIQKSGLADVVAHAVVGAGREIAGPVGVVVAIYLVTNLLTELVSNVGAAAIMFPVAVAAADSMGLDLRPLAITIAVAASASFSTPIGYQTNLMVYGPGGYRFLDFVKAGLPMNLMVMVAASILIPLFWHL